MVERIVSAAIGDDPPRCVLRYGTDVRDGLRTLEDESVHCVVTSPPYWGLRDYQTSPSVWGGDPQCAHDWTHQVLVRKGSTNGQERSTLDSRGSAKTVGVGVETNVPGTHYRQDASDDCRRCGAWRGQLGLEPHPDQYVAHVIEIFREVRRVLRPDGTLWLNLGDSYAQGKGHGYHTSGHSKEDAHHQKLTRFWSAKGAEDIGLKHKDLVGIPWRVALALQADGWWLRNDIVWRKPNPIPSPVQDRLSNTYEHIFLLTRNARYYFDLNSIRVPFSTGRYDEDGSFTPSQVWNEEPDRNRKMDETEGQRGTLAGPPRKFRRGEFNPAGKNPSDIWTIPTQPFAGNHFAVWPEAIPERCIRAGTSDFGVCGACGAPYYREGGERVPVPGRGTGIQHAKGNHQPNKRSAFRTSFPWSPTHKEMVGWSAGCDCVGAGVCRAVVLDPFSGSGTTGKVAMQLDRDYVGLDLNAKYLDMAASRVRGDAPKTIRDVGSDLVSELFGGDSG